MDWSAAAVYLSVIIRLHRNTTYVDAVCCYRPSRVVCLSVTLVNPAKMTEPIECRLGWGLRWAQEPRIRWSRDPPWEGAIL